MLSLHDPLVVAIWLMRLPSAADNSSSSASLNDLAGSASNPALLLLLNPGKLSPEELLLLLLLLLLLKGGCSGGSRTAALPLLLLLLLGLGLSRIRLMRSDRMLIESGASAGKQCKMGRVAKQAHSTCTAFTHDVHLLMCDTGCVRQMT
jgi:hypothetical protein